MKIAVLPNLSHAKALQHTGRLIACLKEIGMEVLLQNCYRAQIPAADAVLYDDLDGMIAACDMIVALGGDGTIIHCARRAACAGKPILGVNVGHLGFLAELETDEFGELRKLAEGSFRIEERMMLEIRCTENGSEKRCTALNDAVIFRGSLSPMPDFRVAFNGQTVCDFRGDGVIVATPTGSTAYSLSAGGPIIDPNLACLMLTPVCSHSLLTRPTVFGPDARLSIQVRFRTPSEAFLTIDGETFARIDTQQSVEICRSDCVARIVRLKNHNFYDIVNEKLGNGRNEP